MSELLLSKKFIPVYFLVGILAAILFKTIGLTGFEIFGLTFLCFLVGILSLVQNFILKK
ncbi:hypothetical protein NYE67_01220 [Solibacillus sp. FSL W8-0474]|uniref:hypothetical protein n=1 Tax=Solibacillus sp. FSL W8-0474 TaxID=2975336 RepID=UPI0030F937EF